jgi:hypothetical protein
VKITQDCQSYGITSMSGVAIWWATKLVDNQVPVTFHICREACDVALEQFQKLEIKNNAHFHYPATQSITFINCLSDVLHILSAGDIIHFNDDFHKCLRHLRLPGCLRKSAIHDYEVRDMSDFLESVQKQFPNLYRLEIAVPEGQNALYAITVKDAVESLTRGQQFTYSSTFSLSTSTNRIFLNNCLQLRSYPLIWHLKSSRVGIGIQRFRGLEA